MSSPMKTDLELFCFFFFSLVFCKALGISFISAMPLWNYILCLFLSYVKMPRCPTNAG